jgi:hypothetical protein
VNIPDQSEIASLVPHVDATSLGITRLVIKDSSCPWFHQEAIALMGLIRLID